MNIFLTLHIAGAIITFLFLGLAIYAIVKKTQKLYKIYFLTLAGLGAFQVISGVVLAMILPSTTLLGTCAKLSVYIAPILFVQLILYRGIREKAISWQRS